MPDIVDDEHQKIANDIKKTMAIYREAEDLINVVLMQKEAMKN